MVADIVLGKVLLFTSEGIRATESFSYMWAQLSGLPVEICVVSVKAKPLSWKQTLRKKIQKIYRLGFWDAFEIISSLPLSRMIGNRHSLDIEQRIRCYTRSKISTPGPAPYFVDSVNGPDAESRIKLLNPDIIVQAGAGILRENIFSIPRLGTLNLHHGIAPAIRGMNSIYWALWESRLDWIGSTVHLIDQGIDTGQPLKWFRVTPTSSDENFASLFARAHIGGVAALRGVVSEMLNREHLEGERCADAGVYRSTFSGWKMLCLGVKSHLKRYHTQS